MSIVAHSHPFVVGVDTHSRNHVYAILAMPAGELLDTKEFPASTAGINRALAWVARRTGADANTLWVIEGAGSYGAILAGTLAVHGFPTAEASRMDTTQNFGVGKSDSMDAHRIATAALPIQVDKLRRPRLSEGVRQSLQILVTARDSMTKDRTRTVNALNALVRSHALGIDARKKLTHPKFVEISKWRARQEEELSICVARSEAVRLARNILALDDQLKTNEQQLIELVKVSEAAPLLEEAGFGPVTAARCVIAWSHENRIRTEASFAALAGVNPIPASSGNTVRHRLNRGGEPVSLFV